MRAKMLRVFKKQSDGTLERLRGRCGTRRGEVVAAEGQRRRTKGEADEPGAPTSAIDALRPALKGHPEPHRTEHQSRDGHRQPHSEVLAKPDMHSLCGRALDDDDVGYRTGDRQVPG
jgi:hypothetical protein